MKVYKIELTVDDGWLEAIRNLTDVDIPNDEFLRWESVTEDDTSQLSYSYTDMANLDHERQVLLFGWCKCEEQEVFPYDDCPIEEK